MSIVNKSVLGQPFDKFVQDQLKVRSQKLSSVPQGDIPNGNLNRDLDVIKWTTSKTGFIRLTSGVNISEEIAVNLFNNIRYTGDGLAKNFILQGGTLNENGGLRGGVSGPNSAYNVGGISEFGLKPMPGITSVSIMSKGRWGSLREAKIHIKCFNRDQFSAIELLYCRPGFSIFLEWGHTLFFDNGGQMFNNIQFMNAFQQGINRNKLYKDMLLKQEKYSGNYDSFMGPVLNFDVEQNGDGSYDVVVSAISWGYVIESLKINGVSKTIEDNPSAKQFNPELIPGSQYANETVNFGIKEERSNLGNILKCYYKTCNKQEFQDGKIHRIYVKNIYNRDMDQDKTGHSINAKPNLVDSGLLATFTAIPFKISSIKDSTSNNKSELNLNTYIPLGTLLSVMSKNCLLYNKADDPIVNVNFNEKENFCFSPDFHVSVDPRICLIKTSGKLDVLGYDSQTNKINSYLPQFKESRYVGRTMNIMINVDYIINLLNTIEISNDKREVNLYDFLTQLMSAVNLSLGRVNYFNIGVDDTNNTLSIYDTQMLENAPKELSVIYSTGLKSVVRSTKIHSRLSNQLASMIAIGSQASGVCIGEDASTLSQYNKGLTDRLMEHKQETALIFPNPDPKLTDPKKDTLEKYLEGLKNDKNAELIKKLLTDIYIKQQLNDIDIENTKGVYGDILNTIKAKDPATKATTVIPFNFDIKLDGISGVKYGQMFSIEPNRLPKSYLNPRDKTQPAVGFLVTGIDHEIRENTWLTTIRGQAAPLRNVGVKE